jgi:hypothetical protein
MTEGAAGSPDDDEWWGGMFRTSLTEGYPFAVDPPDRAADLVVFLASGRADALSGRFLSVDDNVVALAQRAAEIEAGELYTLRLRT